MRIERRPPAAGVVVFGEGDGAVPADGADAGASQPDLGRIRRILVVEDDWFIGSEIEAILANSGYEVVDLVATADEAVEAALRHAPDLVLMDIRLAGPRDGIDAAIDIRRMADIGALFISAHQDGEARRRAADARPVGWLGKPFTDGQLLSAIARIAEAH